MAVPVAEREAGDPVTGVGRNDRAFPKSGLARRAAVSVVVAAGLAILVGVFVARTGSISGDEGEHVRISSVIGPLTDTNVVHQQFIAEDDGLSAISLRFGTLAGHGNCRVAIRLLAGDAVEASNDVGCGSLPNSALVTALSFSPIATSAGRTYTIEVSVRSTGDTVTLWSGPDLTERLPLATVDGQQRTDSVEFHSRYAAGSFFDRLGTVLSRLDQYRPAWSGSGAVVVFGLGAVLLIAVCIHLSGRRAVLAIVTLALLKGLLWSAFVPPLEGVDETAHASYADFLALDHRLPRRGTNYDGRLNFYSDELRATFETFHVDTPPPGDRPLYGPTGEVAASELDGLSRQASGNGPAAGYPPHYYLPVAALDGLASGPLFLRLYVMRLWSVALGVVTAVLALALGRRVFGRSVVATLFAIAVAFHPMASQQSAIVSNDALVIAGGVACMLASLMLAERADRRGRGVPVLAGASLGVAMLGKAFGAAYVPVIVVAWVIGWLRSSPDRRPRVLPDLGRALVGFGATYGGWVLFAAAFHYPAPTAGDLAISNKPTGLGDFVEILFHRNLEAPRITWVTQFWGGLSWVDTKFPLWIDKTILVALIVGIVVLALWTITFVRDLVRAARDPGGSLRGALTSKMVGSTLLALVGVVSTVLVVYAVGFIAFRRSGTNDFIQGRYGLVGLAPVLLVVPLALQRLVPRLSPVVSMSVVAGAMVALNIGGLALLAAHFYV